MLKDSNRFAVNIQVNKTTPVYIEVDQLDKLFSDSSYKYSDVRMYVVQRSHQIGDKIVNLRETGTGDKHLQVTTSTLVKATLSNKTRTTLIETDLKKGSYTVICECTIDKYQTDYTLSVYYPRNSNLTMELENPIVRRRAYLDMVCGMAIQNGTKEYLSKNENIRRYSFWSEKLSLYVYVFTNNTSDKYCIMEKIKADGDYDCNINIDEAGYMKLYLPCQSKKAVVFRFKKSANSKVDILEHSMQVVNQS